MLTIELGQIQSEQNYPFCAVLFQFFTLHLYKAVLLFKPRFSWQWWIVCIVKTLIYYVLPDFATMTFITQGAVLVYFNKAQPDFCVPDALSLSCPCVKTFFRQTPYVDMCISFLFFRTRQSWNALCLLVSISVFSPAWVWSRSHLLMITIKLNFLDWSYKGCLPK